MKKKRKSRVPLLNEKEQGILERAARKIVRSIVERESDDLKRRLLVHQAVGALEFRAWMETVSLFEE